MNPPKKLPDSFIPIQEYIESLGLPSSVTTIILDPSFVLKNPTFYLSYAAIFADAFETEDQKAVQTLNIAGFLYYRFIIITDHFFDQKILKNDIDLFTYQLAAMSCQEESIKLLCSLFPFPSEFWNYWDQRKKEYLWALKTEKNTKEEFNDEVFAKMADAKSAFGKIAIDSLYIKSKKKYEDCYTRLVKSHTFFSVAFQILDDILDLKTDIVNHQPNYAHFLVLDFLEKEGISLDSENPSMIEKYLHVSGISISLLEKAIDNMSKASEIIKDISVPKWKAIIAGQQYVLNALRTDFQIYIRYLNVKIGLSNTLKPKNHSIKNVLNDAFEFLIVNFQGKVGFWDEYITNGNISSVWATAYINCQLNDIEEDKILELKKQAQAFILRNANPLWGYNPNIPGDADSTNFSLLSLLNNEYPLEQYIELWLSFQNSDGGFSTYTKNQTKELNKIMYQGKGKFGFEGWEQSHHCVSAVSLLLLSHQRNKYLDAYTQVRDYLVKEYEINKVWKPYWWTSEIYLVAFISTALAVHPDPRLLEALRDRVSGLLEKQNENGSFGDSFKQNSSFYTSLMIKALCAHSFFRKQYDLNIKKAVAWTVRNQYTDGSWEATHALRLPAINIISPDQVHLPWKVRRNGLNTRAIEFNRLFTTATTISALTAYSRNFKDEL